MMLTSEKQAELRVLADEPGVDLWQNTTVLSILDSLTASEAQASRFAQRLADGARDSNEALVTLARENARLRNSLELVVSQRDTDTELVAYIKTVLNPPVSRNPDEKGGE